MKEKNGDEKRVERREREIEWKAYLISEINELDANFYFSDFVHAEV